MADLNNGAQPTKPYLLLVFNYGENWLVEEHETEEELAKAMGQWSGATAVPAKLLNITFREVGND